MLRLLLFRHAKAERSRPGERDHERALNARGRSDSPRLGAYLVRHKLVPDLAVVSTALRTRETWELASSVMDRAPPAEFSDRIYEATPEAILKVAGKVAPNVHTLMIVGHNPGLQELAVMLVGTGDVELRQRLTEEFPTASLAVIDFALDDWRRLHDGSGRLERLVTPRSLAAATD